MPPTAPRLIKATAPPFPGEVRIGSAGAVEFQAAAASGGGPPKRPTFAIHAYTGAPIKVDAYPIPAIVDLTGLKAASQEIPILRDHDTSRIVGQTDSVKIDATGVHLTGSITGDDADAQKVTTHAKNGFKWQASIGAAPQRTEYLKPGDKTTVNGREIAGPMVIVRAALLRETSFCALGADGQTSASVAASHPSGTLKGDHTVNFEQWLQASGFDAAALSETQTTALKAAFAASQAPAPAPTPAPAPAPTPAAPVQASAASPASTLDQILAEQAAEEKRVSDITRIVKAAIDARPTLYAEYGRMAKAAIEAKSTVQEFELAVLRVRANVGPNVIVRGDTKASGKVIEAAVANSSGLRDIEKHYDARTLELAHDQFPRGLGLRGLLMLAARENGYTGYDSSDLRAVFAAAFGAPGMIRAEGFSTVGLTTILSNVANKYLAQGFNAVEAGWRQIAKVRPVNDLKSITSATLTGGMIFEKVGAGGELKHATVGETTYSNKADTYGKMFALTREHIINDDLGAFNEIPSRIGRGGALALNQVFWTAFLASRDTFWASGHANVISGTTSGSTSVLSAEGLQTATVKFRQQTDPDGQPLGITPRILLVPPELEYTAWTLINSTNVNTGGSSTVAQVPNANVWSSKYLIVPSTYLSNSSYTGYSTTQWFLLADPADLPTIEVAFLNGRDMPVIESADADFGSLGVQFRGYFDFGCTKQEFRASVRAAGA